MADQYGRFALIAMGALALACNAVLGLDEMAVGPGGGANAGGGGKAGSGAGRSGGGGLTDSGGEAGSNVGGSEVAAGGSVGGSAGGRIGEGGTTSGSGGDAGTSGNGGATGGNGGTPGGSGGAPGGNGGDAGTEAGTGGTVADPECGDGVVDSGEGCDDDGTAGADGCSATCEVELGWACDDEEPTGCEPVCGDGRRVGDELASGCDDGNSSSGDGCSAGCAREGGWACTGTPSVCTRSCTGLDATCGPGGDADCCASVVVPGGTFNRSNDVAYPATLSDFRLDTYEITVGRFRKFVQAFAVDGWRPAPGSGKSATNAADPGWDPAWTAEISSTPVDCNSTFFAWTATPAANEARPLSCLNWYEALAFCIWDGGRLPTEAEWNYAAAGGGDEDGQREYPWSDPPDSTTVDETYASYYSTDCLGDETPGCSVTDLVTVGSKPKGYARWGQAEMAGNVWEWVQDYYGTYPSTCTDCANLSPTAYRGIRGGGVSEGANPMRTSYRSFNDRGPGGRYSGVGARCARTACGDGVVSGTEACDDGNALPGDGCFACGVESGWSCKGTQSVCAPTSPSCEGLAKTCGSSGDGDCCAATAIPGGTFDRSNDVSFPATVSDFGLDSYEITVGRWRKFVEAYEGGFRPALASGRNPKNTPDSGWDRAWDMHLAGQPFVVNCPSDKITWTADAGANESRPINCLNWYEALAFCIWDGGRLPTEAEWNYAAAGGGDEDGQREYPWSDPPDSTTIDDDHASYFSTDCFGDGVAGCNVTDFVTVGSKPAGDARWGQADMAGNAWEWTQDWDGTYPAGCVDCANLAPGTDRVIRGGSNVDGAVVVRSSFRNANGPLNGYYTVGARCARR